MSETPDVAALEAAIETAVAAIEHEAAAVLQIKAALDAAPVHGRRHLPSIVSTNKVSHGVVGATAVASNVDADGLGSTLYVTLGANYARVIPPGYPDPNAGADLSKSHTAFGKTIPNGTRVKFFKHEAQAIVAAGGGTLS